AGDRARHHGRGRVVGPAGCRSDRPTGRSRGRGAGPRGRAGRSPRRERARTVVSGLGVLRKPRPGPAPVLPHVADVTSDDAGFPSWQPSTRQRFLILVNFMAATFYAVWWSRPGHAGRPALFLALAVAEGFTFVHLLGLWSAVWSSRADPPPRSTRIWSIDVLIPTRGEPREVLAKTIQAAVQMDLPHQTFVLDDGARPEVAVIAGWLGASYIARKRAERRGAKA